jgi:protein SCO1/2
MDQTTERPFRTIWIGVALIILIVAGSVLLQRLKPHKPEAAPLPVIGDVAPFTLTNQNGVVITLDDLRGKVWLADIIFTRCPGPCARMTRQMASVQAALPKDSQAKLISLTTDPGFDSPEVLKKYGEKFSADPARWQFLTGSKLALAALAGDSLKLVAMETKPESRTSADDLFIHSTIFVLVDKQARLRGMIDKEGSIHAGFETGGDGIEWTNIQPAIISAIKQLERER